MKDARGMEYAQTMWPDHCVVGTKGVEIEQTLGAHLEPLKEKMRLVRKVSLLSPFAVKRRTESRDGIAA